MSFMHPRTLRSAVLARMTFSGTNGSVTGLLCARCSGGLGGEGPGMVGGRGDPALQRRAVQPGGLHEDHVLHRPSGEVHLPDVVELKCPLGGLGSRAGP